MNPCTLPVFELDQLASSKASLLGVMQKTGAFLVHAPRMESEIKEMFASANALFSLPEEEKQVHMIDKTTCFTGFSNLRNERDNREQFHLFSNFLSAHVDNGNPFSCLKFPNKVPEHLSAQWKTTVSSYMDEMYMIAQSILEIAQGEANSNLQFGASQKALSYCLLKFINYFPTSLESPERTGTPPHIDWSWLTIVLRQNSPGFYLKTDQWTEVNINESGKKDNCFLVMVGELLEVASGGLFKAAPHKVILPSPVESSLSMPYFFSPDLDSTVKIDQCYVTVDSMTSQEHIHRVFEPGEISGDFHFGGTELNRKRFGRWCYSPGCCQ